MVKPYGNHLIVKRDSHEMPHDVPDRFMDPKNIIVAPLIARAKSRRGKVIAVGPDVEENIRKGDIVLITWLDGTKFSDKDLGEIELFRESEILALVTH